MSSLAMRFQNIGRILRVCGMAMAASVLFSACESLPQKTKVDFAEPEVARPIPALPVVTGPSTGGLFNKVSYRPAFEDPRARTIGDTVTILIVEKVTASQVSQSTSNRTSSGSIGISAFPLLRAADLAKAAVGTTSANDFTGKGGTESANTFSGSITATVVDVLPNGHLVVTGEKQIGVNQNVDVLRFSGTIDPRVVQPGSIVNSTQVANARIESKGRGAQAEAQTVGWLMRFFFSFLPF